MDAAPICAPEPTQAAGRGIHFMRTMADDVLFACGLTGTRVLLTRRAPLTVVASCMPNGPARHPVKGAAAGS